MKKPKPTKEPTHGVRPDMTGGCARILPCLFLDFDRTRLFYARSKVNVVFIHVSVAYAAGTVLLPVCGKIKNDSGKKEPGKRRAFIFRLERTHDSVLGPENIMTPRNLGNPSREARAPPYWKGRGLQGDLG